MILKMKIKKTKDFEYDILSLFIAITYYAVLFLIAFMYVGSTSILGLFSDPSNIPRLISIPLHLFFFIGWAFDDPVLHFGLIVGFIGLSIAIYGFFANYERRWVSLTSAFLNLSIVILSLLKIFGIIFSDI